MSNCRICEAVKRDLDERSVRGVQKYGTTLGDASLSDRDLLQHAYEEALDLSQYLKALLERKP